jgi:hypothetical protein
VRRRIDLHDRLWSANAARPAERGGPPVTLATDSNGYGIALDDRSVYFVDTNAVMSVPIDGGLPTTIAADTSLFTPALLAVSATHVFWTDTSGALFRKLK